MPTVESRYFLQTTGQSRVPLHFKQWGVWASDSQEFAKSKERREVDHHLMVRVGRKAAGDLLDGRRWQEGPSVDSAPLTLPEEDDPPKDYRY